MLRNYGLLRYSGAEICVAEGSMSEDDFVSNEYTRPNDARSWTMFLKWRKAAESQSSSLPRRGEGVQTLSTLRCSGAEICAAEGSMSEDDFVSNEYTRPNDARRSTLVLEVVKTPGETRGRTGLMVLADVVVEKGDEKSFSPREGAGRTSESDSPQLV